MRTLRIVRDDEDVYDVQNACVEADGQSRYPGMSYEQGVEAAILWMIEEQAVHPINDEG